MSLLTGKIKIEQSLSKTYRYFCLLRRLQITSANCTW